MKGDSMKRNINGKLLLFFIFLLVVATVLLGILVHMEQGNQFQAKLYGHHSFFSDRRGGMTPEGFLGIAAFLLIAAACYGIYKVFQGMGASVTVQIPSVSCILLSVLLFALGGVFVYLEWFKGYEFGRRYRGLTGIILLLLGGMVFYRGLQGKEFRFWHKNWQSFDKEFAGKRKEKSFVCPSCGNRLPEKTENCPVCGREL